MNTETATGSIYKTKDYSLFKKITGNRKVKLRPDLMKSIKDEGLINPIIINEEYEVLDGQHRLAACEALGVSVEYMKRTFNDQTLVAVNTTQQRWVTSDYLERYANLGNPHYIEMAKLMTQYNLSIVHCLTVLRAGRPGNLDSSLRTIFTSGKLKINSEMVENFHFAMRRVNEVLAISDRKKFLHGNLFRALVSLVMHPLYNHQHFLAKLEQTPEVKIKKAGTFKDLFEMLSAIHNHRLTHGRIYHPKKRSSDVMG